MSYYDITDEKIFISAIQRMLRDINYMSYDDASVGITGVYDAQTRSFVMAFQRDMGLSQTGVVDLETWEILSSVHEAVLEDEAAPRAVHLFPKYSSYDIVPDVKNDLLYVIQYMLRETGAQGGAGADLVLTGIYDAKTRNAIRDFKRRNLLDDSTVIDTETLNRLFDEYEIIISSDK